MIFKNKFVIPETEVSTLQAALQYRAENARNVVEYNGLSTWILTSTDGKKQKEIFLDTYQNLNDFSENAFFQESVSVQHETEINYFFDHETRLNDIKLIEKNKTDKIKFDLGIPDVLDETVKLDKVEG